MIRVLACFIACIAWHHASSQEFFEPKASVRLTVLLAPFTPLLTVEVKVSSKISVQAESNFSFVHGLSAKYFTNTSLTGTYFFVGNAWVKNDQLREDKKYVLLPYGGIGFAKRTKHHWVTDVRIGLGPILQADRNLFFPVMKAGFGKLF